MRSAPGNEFACRIACNDLFDHRVDHVDDATDVTVRIECDFDEVVRNRHERIAVVRARIVFVNTQRGAELFGKDRSNWKPVTRWNVERTSR